jgi:peptide chain release factor subunit 1
MLSEKELQELAGFRSESGTVLSVYVNTDLTGQPKEKAKLVLREALDSVRAEAHAEDVARVESYVDREYDWRSRAVAVISALQDDLWRVYPLPVAVQTEAHVGPAPYLKPMTRMLDEYARYVIVLVDREGARLFLMHLGGIEEKAGWAGQEVKRHKQGGRAAERYQRREDQRARQNMRQSADMVVRFLQEARASGLILGGSDETLPRFRELLPKAMQKQIVGTLAIDMQAPAAEVMERATELINAGEQEREARLVEDMVTAAAKGSGAVTGLPDTFYVAHEGRVHTLVVERGFEAAGYLCAGCGYISAESIGKCPFCGGLPEVTSDAVDRVMQKVMDSGGKVEIVAPSDALTKAGRIGAILRY